MKTLFVSAFLMVAPFAMTFSNMPEVLAAPKAIEAINIEMNGDLLIAKSDDPNDPLTLLQVYNRANQLLLQTGCSGTKCTLNISSLPAGLYIGKAFSVNSHKAISFYKN